MSEMKRQKISDEPEQAKYRTKNDLRISPHLTVLCLG